MNLLAVILGHGVVEALGNLGAMILLLFVVGSSLIDVLSQRADVAASAAMLEQLEGRGPGAAGGQAPGIAGPSGSPFLEGATVTVAGAALLQHVTAAVTRLGGNVLSSQVDLQGTQSKSGFLTVIASCDIDQPGLQQLLYDVESGMPFLFVDQLAGADPRELRRIAVTTGCALCLRSPDNGRAQSGFKMTRAQNDKA